MLIKYFIVYVILLISHTYGKSESKRKYLTNDLDEWKGKYFPGKPSKQTEPHKQNCDNEKSIAVDFDPDDHRHSFNYLCLFNRSIYKPNMEREALLQQHFIPFAYTPTVKCLNESIQYEEGVPTFGAFRPNAAVYGTYKYLPPQRYIRSLAEGAIVMLYHPCAFAGQIKILQDIISSCLYRHIITPTQALSSERPLALLSWGKILQISVVDKHLVIEFIKDNAKKGPLTKDNRIIDAEKTYKSGLLTEAHLITDEHDTEICGYAEM